MRVWYDYLSYPRTEPQKGRTLFLLGLAKDGPIFTPLQMRSLEAVQAVFGTEGSLYRAFERAFQVNPNLDIYLMRINGEYARCTLYGFVDWNIEPVLQLRCINGGEKYNDIQVMIAEQDDQMVLQFSFPEDAGLSTVSYPLANYPTLEILVRDINNDTRSGSNLVFATTNRPELPPSVLLGLTETKTFSGGEDGLYPTKDGLFLALEEAYKLLEGYWIDVIVPVDARFDDVHPVAIYGKDVYGTKYYSAQRDYLALQDTENNNRFVTFHGQLIRFCQKQMQLGIMTHGVIGLNVVEDPTDLEKHEYSYIIRLLEATAFRNHYDLAVFENGQWKDTAYYISVTAGELVYNEGTDDEYVENIAVTYAAMLASLAPQESTTNRPIPGATKLRYQFTTGELQELAKMGVVAPRESVRKGIVIANGVTPTMSHPELKSVANVRLMQFALAQLNETLDTFVGQPLYPLLQHGAIEKAVYDTLEALKNEGFLVDYDYRIQYDENEGICVIEVEFLGINMVEFLTTRAELQLGGTGV